MQALNIISETEKLCRSIVYNAVNLFKTEQDHSDSDIPLLDQLIFGDDSAMYQDILV